MRIILSYIVLLFFSAVSIYSQTLGSIGMSDARSMGLGNEYTVISSGVYSIGKNPANLSIKTSHSFEVATLLPLPNVNAVGGSNFISIEDFNYFFVGNTNSAGELNGKELSTSDKQRFLDLFTANNEIHTNVSYTIFSMSYYAGESIGAFAFSMHDQAAVNSNIPKDIVDLILYGNEVGQSYSLNNAQLDAWVLRSYSLSYAKDFVKIFPTTLKSVHIGVSFKYIQGIAYASLNKVNTSMITNENNYAIHIQSDLILHSAISPDFGVTYDFENVPEGGTDDENFTPFPEPVGSGFGFDIGFTSEINDKIKFGASLTDIGSINWDTETAEFASVTDFILDDLTEEEVLDSLFDTIIGDGQFVDGYSTSLATALHIGGSFQISAMDKSDFPGLLLITGGYHQGFNNLPGNSTTPRFALGIEWQVAEWFQLRTGSSFGGRDGFNWAFGLGFDASLLEFNLATSSLTGAVGSGSSKIISVSIGTRWKF